MAVVTATNLRKELSGEPLFDGVSFKVERRDRVSLSGPNGAGKTTLLRLLNGETELHGGTISMAKGTRIALHDQRPPAESAATLRDYVLSGAADLTAAERELRRLEDAMAAGRPRARDAPQLRRDPGAPRARGRLRLARAARLGHAQPRFLDERPRPAPLQLLRRRADPRLARPRRSAATPISCSSTSRRTTSTSPASSGWSASCSPSTPQSSSSRTTAGSSKPSRTQSSSSKPAARPTSPGPGTTGAARKPLASPRPRPQPAGSTSTSPGSSASSSASATRRASPSAPRPS